MRANLIGDKPFLYLAAPLFSRAEKVYNEQLASTLAHAFTVYLPQRDGGLFLDLMQVRGMTADEASRYIFALDLKALMSADVVLAVLDGRAIDEGVAVELGYAYGIGKPCFGIQCDPRRLLPVGNNPMITGVLRRIAHSAAALPQLIDEMVATIEERSRPS